MPQKVYTMVETRMILGIDNKTLKDWCEKAGIVPIPSEDDHRVKCLTTTHIAQLAHRHQRALSPAAIQRSPMLQGIMRRLELLEDLHSQKDARIQELEQEVTTLKAKILPFPVERTRPPADTSVPAPSPRQASHTPARTNADGSISARAASRLAVEHGANSQDGARNWIMKDLSSHPEILASLAACITFIHAHLLERQHYRQSAGIWHHCAKADCDCHAQGGDQQCVTCFARGRSLADDDLITESQRSTDL